MSDPGGSADAPVGRGTSIQYGAAAVRTSVFASSPSVHTAGELDSVDVTAPLRDVTHLTRTSARTCPPSAGKTLELASIRRLVERTADAGRANLLLQIPVAGGIHPV